jgi:hypothetical protein
MGFFIYSEGMKRIVFTSLASLYLTSCATIFSDGHDRVTIKSEPSGADVFINEEHKGKTPLEFDLERNTFKEAMVRVKKEGYESSEFRMKKTLNSTAIFNTTFLLSWGTDALSGKMIQYSPNAYFTELKRSGASKKSGQLSLGEQARFAHVNFQKLQADIAKGDGEFLSNYLEIAELSPRARQASKLRIYASRAQLSKISDPSMLHHQLQNLL